MIARSLALAALVVGAFPAHAAVSVGSPSFTYTQNFDSLTQSNTSTPWLNDSTLAGWSLFTSANAAITGYSADNGGSNSGSFLSYGTTSSSDRALGSLASGGTYFGSPASGSVAGYTAVALRNDTGSMLTGFTLGYQGEQWRNGGNTTAQSLTVQYGYGGSFASVSSWTNAGAAFNFASPVATASAAAVDGNAAGKVNGLGGSVTSTWNSGETLWVRWTDTNDVGNDHGLAIDNLSLTVNQVMAVPEADGYALALAGFGAVGFFARRRK